MSVRIMNILWLQGPSVPHDNESENNELFAIPSTSSSSVLATSLPPATSIS